jgi:hypothetical protein
MDEPVLACGAFGANEAFRLTWTHAFTQFPPLVIRAVRSGERRTVVAAVFDWAPKPSGAVILRVRTRHERSLSEDEWVKLSSAINAAEFWNTPGGLKEFGNDGSTWLLEGRRNRGYHMVMKWSPDDGSFRSAALYLIRLGGLTEPEAR